MAKHEMKTCITCKECMPIKEYWRQKSKTDGLFNECKKCNKKRQTRWRYANSDKVREDSKKRSNDYRKNRPEWNLLRATKNSAKKKGIVNTLVLEDILIPEYCPVLSIKLCPMPTDKSSKKWRDACASIDRIDNSIGYIKENIVVVSWRANRLKSDASIAEMEMLCKFYGGIDERNR